MPRIGLLIAAALCAAALGSAWLVDMPDVAGTLRAVTGSLGPWTYAIVAALVAIETGAVLGLVSPGEAMLAVGPFLAGASAMPLRRVAGYSLVGAGVWCGAMIAAGYAFAGSLESHADAAGSIAIGVCGGLLLAWALTRGQAPQERAASAYICARAR